MARRKRLSPARGDYLDDAPPAGAAAAFGAPPIARVAGDSAATAALAEVAEALQSARDQGRLVELLPLHSIDAQHLVRDRLGQDEDDRAALRDSLRARGQQTPIEVTRLPAPRGEQAYGLISGWRRLDALRHLHAETGEDRFATVKALVVTPASAQEAYVAMVEENEIRVDLSHYERARIVLKAVQEDVYPDMPAALQGLFGNATRSKRSKIGSFTRLVEAFDDLLAYPAAISEKLGLALLKALKSDPTLADRLRRDLRQTARSTAEGELALLAAVLPEDTPPSAAATTEQTARKDSVPARSDPAPRPVPQRLAPDLALRFDPDRGRIELTGAAVTEDLRAALSAWLATRQTL